MPPERSFVGSSALCRDATELPTGGPGGRRGLQPGCGGGTADRFCAWAGRSGRRYIMEVVPLDRGCRWGEPDVGTGTIVLAVRRPPSGPRCVLWAALPTEDEALGDVLAQARILAADTHELHLYRLATGKAERAAVLADLPFPRLAERDPQAASPALQRSAELLQGAAISGGASMKPPDCRRHRSA